MSLIARNGQSEQFPPYLMIPQVKVNAAHKIFNQGPKLCFPDKVSGISEEFPS